MLQTCKFLYDLTFDEHLWRVTVRMQCIQNDVPLISYNLAEMGVTELEEAACKPYRFQYMLEQSDPSHRRSRTLRLSVAGDIPKNHQVTDAITTMEIIPGGRYLVTTSESGWLRCWDLVAQGASHLRLTNDSSSKIHRSSTTVRSFVGP